MDLSDIPDFIIRGGTIVDGTGVPPVVGDVAVKGDKIWAIGPRLPFRGKHEYDASGMIVAPGWVDAHTHFDGQVTWDPYLTPSASGGVTTCVMGNCGVGFAPCQRERRDEMIEMVEAIEDVPREAVREGLRWEWETFEEYMDALSRRELACDVAAMVGHSTIRNWVLGDRMNLSDRPHGAENAPVQPHEIEAMAAVVRDAVAAGAMGFSTSRAIYHRDLRGVLMPGSLASSDEMLALARAIGEGGGGVFGANMDFRTYDDVPGHEFSEEKRKEHYESEWRWLDTIASESKGRTNITFEAMEVNFDRVARVEQIMRKYNDVTIRTQCHVRPQSFLQSVNSRMNLLMMSKTYRQLHGRAYKAASDSPKDFSEHMHALLVEMTDPNVRRTILEEAQSRLDRVKDAIKNNTGDPYRGLVSTLCPFSHIFPWTPNYEPEPAISVRETARREGRTPLEVYYDILVPPGKTEFGVAWKPNAGYMNKDVELTRVLLEHPFGIPGVSDAGAHSGIFCDAHGPTHLLTFWVRDRTRGPRIALETAVMKQTLEIAKVFGLHDRGALLPGRRADINIIDMSKLEMLKPFVSNDLPKGTTRWMQSVTGYQHTFVAGQETFRFGEPTGLLPGRFVRNPKADASVWQGAARRCVWRSSDSKVEAVDLSAHALKSAEGGGASAIARIARELEKEGEGTAGAGAAGPPPRGRL